MPPAHPLGAQLPAPPQQNLLYPPQSTNCYKSIQCKQKYLKEFCTLLCSKVGLFELVGFEVVVGQILVSMSLLIIATYLSISTKIYLLR